MANDVNCVILVGRLTRDAELTYSSAGMAIGKFSVAVNRRKRNGEQWVDEANFFDVAYFGKGAEAVKQYLTKGKQVAISGSLTQQRWTEQQTNQQRSKVSVVANSVQLLGSRENAQGQPQQNTQGSGQGFYQPPSQQPAPGVDFEDEIPF